jgi:dTDP-glucose 4,6-dehydratase
MILVTGGAGFIGSNFVLDWLSSEGTPVVNLDKLTYAGNLSNLAVIKNDERHVFVQGDITDCELIRHLLKHYKPHAVVHFAAESHVDRSIHDPGNFIQTNVIGTFHVLQEALAYWQALEETEQQKFRFLHVSTDEVYGSLGESDMPFTEVSAYAPNSPYSASKAASDHLVRAYHHTYGLPTLTSNCSNNYGPFQFPEKLIPLMILNALQSKPLPIYGDGKNVRDWLYVADHCAAIRKILSHGCIGETYNVGGWNEKTNLEVVHTLCNILEQIKPAQRKGHYASLVTYIKDRPGHDRRYAIDARKIERELGWRPKESFESGLQKTVQWYADNRAWTEDVVSGNYQSWIAANYTDRASV